MVPQMEQLSYPRAERKRKLQNLAFAESSILSRELPRDTVLKSLQLRLSGSVVTTFGSGTPVADALSTFDNIIPRIDVTVGGSRVIKSVRPYLMANQQLATTHVLGERKSSAAAAAATDNLPTVDAGFTYGTTTQISTVAETVLVSFENPWLDWTDVQGRGGREQTWLNLRGVSSAEVKLTTAAFSSLLGFGNTAPVVFSSSTFIIDIFTVEAQDVPAEVVFSDWKQTTKDVSFSAETTDYAIDINRGNYLQAITLLGRSGAAGSATTASGKLLTNLLVTKLQLMVNGQTAIKTDDFKGLQAENRARYGVTAPMASNVSRLDGWARIDLIARRDINTALNCQQPQVDNVQLIVSTNNSTNVSYTNPCTLTIMTEEIVRPR